jgi:hypothetical protein
MRLVWIGRVSMSVSKQAGRFLTLHGWPGLCLGSWIFPLSSGSVNPGLSALGSDSDVGLLSKDDQAQNEVSAGSLSSAYQVESTLHCGLTQSDLCCQA